MAFGQSRFVLIAAAAFSLSMTATVNTIAAPYVHDGTIVIASPYDFVVGDLQLEPAFVLPSADIAERRIVRGHPAYQKHKVNARRAGAAVQPTSIAGWRSGRVRHLASG